MQSSAHSNSHSIAMVCVDSYEKGNLAGKFYTFHDSSAQDFSSLTQLLSKMEHRLGGVNLQEPQPHSRGSPGNRHWQGELATFTIRVLFRQNSSWQGSISWLERGSEHSFRSVLELIQFMDSALHMAQ